MTYKVVIVDYKSSNLDSVLKATKKFEDNCVVSNKYQDIANAEKLILPGQGSFHFGMQKIIDLNIYDILVEKIKLNKTPTLGICLGMHLLADYGYEVQKTKGLSIIKGTVVKMKVQTKLPHIGWNEVKVKEKNILFKDIPNDKDFYFVHSYEFFCDNSKNIIGTSFYGKNFTSFINFENIFGVQFHPEKSLKFGLKIISNFLNI